MRYWALILGIFGIEYGVKNHIDKKKTENVYEDKLHGKIRIGKYHNHGAVLNAGQSRPWLVTLLSVILSVGLTVVFIITLGHTGNGLLKTGLALLLGGAYSNTYDRLSKKYVVDYLNFNVPWKWLNQIVFNSADFCILIGALLCVLGGDV